MNKIPSVFMRNPENMHELTQTPHPDALWVIAGEGVPTRKYYGPAPYHDAYDILRAVDECRIRKVAS